MQKKVHEKKSASEMFIHSLHRPRFSMISDISSTQDINQEIGHKRISEVIDPYRKSFLVHDDEYNSMIYEWRKVQTAPIVKVFMVCKDHDLDGRTGEIIVKNIVRAEKIVKRLTEVSELSMGEALYILKNMLQGHQTIYKKLGATTISLEKCGLNEAGELKVWVNQNFIRNEMSGEVLCFESRIVSRIFEIIDMIMGNKMKNFRNYVLRNVEASDWSFLLMNRIIQDYVNSLRIQLPNTVRGLSGICTMKRISHRGEKLEQHKRASSSVKCSSRERSNIQSSLNFSTKSPHAPQQKRFIRSQIYDSHPIKRSFASTKNTIESQMETTMYKNHTPFIPSRTQFDLPKMSIGERKPEEEQTDGFLTERKDKLCIQKQYDHFYIPGKHYLANQISMNEGKSEKKVTNFLKHSQISTQNPGSHYQEQNKRRQLLQKLQKKPSMNLKITNDNFGKCYFTQMKNDFPKLLEQFQSYENTENNSSQRQSFSFDNKIEKAGENKANLKILEQSSLEGHNKKEEKVKKLPRPSFRQSEEQIALEEALENLLTSAKEQEILQHNSWTKKIDGLFTNEVKQLKQSINYETSEDSSKKNRKLTELSKWGRQVKESQIPE